MLTSILLMRSLCYLVCYKVCIFFNYFQIFVLIQLFFLIFKFISNNMTNIYSYKLNVTFIN